MSSRRALLRHLWAMIQTRAEAASLVVQLQRTAVTQGLLFFGIAAVTALSFMTAVIVWVAVAAPPSWRGWALGLLALALLGASVFSVVTGRKKLRGDANLIADFTQGLKLDLAMLNLAFKDPNTEDEEKLAERERAKEKVRDAAAEKADTPSTAEDGAVPVAGGPAQQSADAALRAARPRPDIPPERPAAAEEAARAGAAQGAPGTPGSAAASGSPPRREQAGYAFTGGGTYASTAPPVVEDHAMPEALGDAGTPRTDGQDTERKQGHGIT